MRRCFFAILMPAITAALTACAANGDPAPTNSPRSGARAGQIEAVGLLVVNTAAATAGTVPDTIRINLYFRPRGGGTFVELTEGTMRLMLFDGVLDRDVDWRRLQPHLTWNRSAEQLRMWGRGTTHVGWVYSVPLMWRPHQAPRSSQVTIVGTYYPPDDGEPIHTVPAVVTMR